jgi:hypothetical protein
LIIEEKKNNVDLCESLIESYYYTSDSVLNRDKNLRPGSRLARAIKKREQDLNRINTDHQAPQIVVYRDFRPLPIEKVLANPKYVNFLIEPREHCTGFKKPFSIQ